MMGWAACGCVLAVLAPASAIAASPRIVRVGSPPLLPAGARVLGALAPTTRLGVTFALAPRDPAALLAFATAVSTPGSGVYGRYLTPRQFAERFGPTRAAVRQVESSLRAHGLAPGSVSANGLSIHVAAPAHALERALHVTLDRLALPGRRTATAAAGAPALDAGIAHLVQAVIGLNGAVIRKPEFVRPPRTRQRAAGELPNTREHVATGGPQPCAAAAAAAPAQSALTSDQLASAYGFSGLYGAGNEGQGQTVALYELEPNDLADITAFQTCYGTHANVSYIPVDGGSGSGIGSGEAALDIEAVIGLAPRANVLVYQGPNSNSNSPGSGPFDLFSRIVSDDQAHVVSASWGQCETVEGTADAAAEATLFEEAAAQGQTIVSAAGDSGSEDCFIPPGTSGANSATQTAVDDPASQPFVTGVGGTALTSLGPRPTESVWNSGCKVVLVIVSCGSGAGGGGISDLWQMPAYQSATPASLNVLNGASSACGGLCREVPDVSADASPSTGFLIYWNGSGSVAGQPTGWQSIGGTSLAAPIWGALFTLANASPGCAGSSLGFVNPALYGIAATAYASNFNDVTSGNNDFTTTNHGEYPAGPGFDMASGLGSPNAASLAPTLCADRLRLAAIGPRSSTVDTLVSIQPTAAGGSGIKYGASGLPDGVFINASTGRIAGTPDRIGVSTVTIQASDAAGAIARTSFLWWIGAPPSVSHASLTGLGRGRPQLKLTLRAGRGALAIDTFVIALPQGLKFGSRARQLRLDGHVPFAATVSHGALAVTLESPSMSVGVHVGYATLMAGRSLVRAVRARHAKRLTLSATATDLLGNATRVAFRVKPSR
jgi:subtilase family serine protease